MDECGTKGQISVEYLTVTAFLLAVVGILFGYSLITLSDNSKLASADAAVKTLANAANSVGSLGSGNAVYVNIDVPNDVQSGSASGYEIKYVVGTMGGGSEASQRVNNSITPASLPLTAGLYVIKVEMADGNILLTQV